MAFNTNQGKQQFTATAGQTVFTFNFAIFADTNIKVYKTPSGQVADDTADLLTLSTNYTVSINGTLGGTVTLLVGTGLNDTVTIVRSLPISRTTDYQSNGDLYADTLDSDQDYQTYLVLDQLERWERSIVIPETYTGGQVSFPVPEQYKLIRWNLAGNGFENIDPSTVLSSSDAAIIENVTDFASIDTSVYTTAIVKNSDRGGIFIWSATGTANGGTVFAGATGYWKRQYSGAVNVKWFGFTGDGTTADAVLLQYVFTNFTSITIPKQTYLLNTTISIQSGTVLYANGANFTSTTNVTSFSLNNVTNVTIYDLRLNGAYNTLSDTPLLSITKSQYINVYNQYVSQCDIGINVGNQTDETNSEICFYSINTYNVVTPIQTQGANTQVFLNSCILVGIDDNIHYSKTAKVIINKGGSVHIANGTVMAPASATGYCIYMEPTTYLAAPDNKYKYGKISAVNVTMETAGALVKTFDAGLTLANINRGAVIFDSCGSYTTNNTLPFIYTDAGFADMISVTSCRFIAASTRAPNNITALNASVKINSDSISWLNNFADYINGTSGGILSYVKDKIVLNAASLVGNTLVNNTYLSLVWAANSVGARYSSNFDGTSYTVPAGGFSTLKVDAYIELLESAVSITSVELEIVVNGTVLAVRNLTPPSISSYVYASIQGVLYNVAAGTAVKIRAKTHGAGATGTVNGTFRIVASY